MREDMAFLVVGTLVVLAALLLSLGFAALTGYAVITVLLAHLSTGWAIAAFVAWLLWWVVVVAS